MAGGPSLYYNIFLVQFFMIVCILAKKLDNCFVVHLLEPAMKRCFTGDLCSLGTPNKSTTKNCFQITCQKGQEGEVVTI